MIRNGSAENTFEALTLRALRQTIFQSGDLSIEVAPDATPQALIFKFPAQFTSDICDSAIEVWSQFCDDSEKPYHHVWDCSGMTSFEMAAKKSGKGKWTNAPIPSIILV